MKDERKLWIIDGIRVPIRTPQIRQDPETPQTGSGLGIDPERSGIRSDAENPQKSGIYGDYPHQTRSGA
ncbi:hypothetical protein PGTUg99_025391 [Puccinia graminis f. sp. tritici]|uniref:Uncharacterized protein n=1 Tax=Puccinia graminis f. sp. tritici TaxID=56615 RepID=A0A5B0R9J5_PUCGR|nr:hypothetical protein PGTUg99_025391 [Puccinia graminis f. sp. tritici]